MSVPEAKVASPLPRACSHCPWRISNQGKRTTDGFYSKANLQRLWNGMKQGEQMSCHPTDPRMNEFESAPRVSDDATTHVCTGATILVQREWMRFQAIATANPGKDPFRLYRALDGPRMTREGLFEVAMRASVAPNPLIVASGRPDLGDRDVQYLAIGLWDGQPS